MAPWGKVPTFVEGNFSEGTAILQTFAFEGNCAIAAARVPMLRVGTRFTRRSGVAGEPFPLFVGHGTRTQSVLHGVFPRRAWEQEAAAKRGNEARTAGTQAGRRHFQFSGVSLRIVGMAQPVASTLLSPELLAKLEKMELLSRKVFRGRMKGERRSPRKGQSVEFADFRNYAPGDDLRFVDWNTYARLEKLFLKMFMEEEDLHFYALVDASQSMDFGDPTKLHFARQLAAALGFVGLTRGDRVKIETIGQSPTEASPAFRGRRSLWRMLEHVEKIAPSAATDLASGVKNFCLRNSGKGIVVLLSDLMDKTGFETGLRYLASQQMDVYVIQTLSPAEFEPDVQGDLRLIDCEDGDEAEITVSAPLVKRYQQTLAAFIASAQEFCARRGMSYVLARTETPVEDLLTGYLAARGLVR
jgi:uncharacterized protein (DUF58 family)